MPIEPEYYAPVIPLVLVNGASGIGTGWSTNIPNYNPREIIANVRHMIRGEPLEAMLPWFRGFDGSITPGKKQGKFVIEGNAELMDDGVTLIVSELPVGTWTQKYKEMLDKMLNPGAHQLKTPQVRIFVE